MDETVDTLTLCCNLREHYLKLNLKEQQELLWLCFSKITLMRGEYRLKKGKGRKKKMDSWSPILNEPFQTLRSLKIHELLAQEEDKDIKLTKKSLSPNYSAFYEANGVPNGRRNCPQERKRLCLEELYFSPAIRS